MALPVRRAVEGVVVSSRAHQMSFGGTCLTCGQPDTEPRCEPDTFLLAPPLTVAGETG